MEQERVFNIGMALAGGSTRGAYSAGAMDFLLQALREWERLREAAQKDPSSVNVALPPWFVRLTTLAGTSAGGITAAISAGSICTPYEPLPNNYKLGDPAPKGNNLFKLWVKLTSSEHLLSCSDLDPDAARKDSKVKLRLSSIVNSKFMEEKSEEALQAASTDMPKPRWADKLELYLTTANLRGIPYHVSNFRGPSKELSSFRMTRHRDWVGFKTYKSDRTFLLPLDLNADRDNDQWRQVKDVAQATASLPVAFPTKSIHVQRETYETKLPWGQPQWPTGMSSDYVYDAVDGGLFRNEPIELVRSSMEDIDEGCLSHNAEESRGSMILLHPSPTREGYDPNYHADRNMIEILSDLINALMEDSRFLEHEVQELTSEDDMTRFLIAPARAGRKPGQDVLGTDTLRGFGGLIDESVRLHDFQLGRRNCQKFLLSHFGVPLEKAKKNRIFGEESEQFARDNGHGLKIVPIIPLLGSAVEECPLPQWPSYDAERKRKIHEYFNGAVEKRISTLCESFAVSMNFYKRGFAFGLNRLWNLVVGKLVKIATDRAMKLVAGPIRAAIDQFSEQSEAEGVKR